MRGPHRAMQRKIGLRTAFTPSVIGAAGVLSSRWRRADRAARFAIGGGITPPQCLDGAAASIVGVGVDEVHWCALRDLLAAEIEAPSDHLRSSDYRKIAAANALVVGLGREKAIEQVCAPPSQQRPAPRIAPGRGPSKSPARQWKSGGAFGLTSKTRSPADSLISPIIVVRECLWPASCALAFLMRGSCRWMRRLRRRFPALVPW